MSSGRTAGIRKLGRTFKELLKITPRNFRLGVTKPAIYQAERKEQYGGVTLQHMDRLADAMGGKFVYAVVPADGQIEDILRNQAHEKAEAIVRRASSHMAPEKRSLSSE